MNMEGKLNKAIKSNKIKILKLSLYTIFIIAITILLTITVKTDKTENTGDVNPYKSVEETKFFDKFFAFGSDSARRLFKTDLILNSNLISDEDKEKLKPYKNQYCNIYMGTKDGTDLVSIGFLQKPWGSLVFKSNLNYKFEDIIKNFEKQSNFTLTDDFLAESKFDQLLGKEVAGILVSFKSVDDYYSPYYYAYINGKLYIA